MLGRAVLEMRQNPSTLDLKVLNDGRAELDLGIATDLLHSLLVERGDSILVGPVAGRRVGVDVFGALGVGELDNEFALLVEGGAVCEALEAARNEGAEGGRGGKFGIVGLVGGVDAPFDAAEVVGGVFHAFDGAGEVFGVTVVVVRTSARCRSDEDGVGGIGGVDDALGALDRGFG